ncbi:Spy0128 family protein [Vagococcus elongatus]|nr:FctA domain-containing protein [Vagococcus elongatus]
MTKQIKLKMFVLFYLIAFGIMLTPEKVEAQSNASVTFSVQQVFESDVQGVEQTFLYQLKALKDSSSVPDSQYTNEFELTGSTSHSMVLSFTEPGVYQYELFQVLPDKLIKGYTYDRRHLTIEVTVSYDRNRDLQALMIAKDGTGYKVKELSFFNTFKGDKVAGLPDKDGKLPQTGEERAFFLLVIGLVIFWCGGLILAYKHIFKTSSES